MSSVNTGLSLQRALELTGRSQKWVGLSIGVGRSAISQMTRKPDMLLSTAVRRFAVLEINLDEYNEMRREYCARDV